MEKQVSEDLQQIEDALSRSVCTMHESSRQFGSESHRSASSGLSMPSSSTTPSRVLPIQRGNSTGLGILRKAKEDRGSNHSQAALSFHDAKASLRFTSSECIHGLQRLQENHSMTHRSDRIPATLRWSLETTQVASLQGHAPWVIDTGSGCDDQPNSPRDSIGDSRGAVNVHWLPLLAAWMVFE